jgi:N-methylhydantoinase A/oxoprolinase/acetone carboxylase beta subunit
VYETVYGYTNTDDALEGVTWRLKAVRPTPKLTSRPEAGSNAVTDAKEGTRRVYDDGSWDDYAVYDRERLPTGATVEGPAIVDEDESTTVVTPNYEFVVGPAGGLHVTRT